MIMIYVNKILFVEINDNEDGGRYREQVKVEKSVEQTFWLFVYKTYLFFVEFFFYFFVLLFICLFILFEISFSVDHA